MVRCDGRIASGEIYLLENIRRMKEMKRPSVCEKLADGRYFVNDAFAVHREHASLWAFPNLPWIYGFLFEEEVANFQSFNPNIRLFYFWVAPSLVPNYP